MKTFLLSLIVLTIASNTQAETINREYKKISSTHAQVVIKVEEDFVQAAEFVDQVENARYMEDLLKDPNSPLAQIKKQIEKDNCDENSTEENSWIDGCGEVRITKEVLTGFGRGGWAGAGATYTFFIGFSSDGTGRFFDVTHMITFSESAGAEVDNEGNFTKIVTKDLELIKIKKLEE